MQIVQISAEHPGPFGFRAPTATLIAALWHSLGASHPHVERKLLEVLLPRCVSEVRYTVRHQRGGPRCPIAAAEILCPDTLLRGCGTGERAARRSRGGMKKGSSLADKGHFLESGLKSQLRSFLLPTLDLTLNSQLKCVELPLFEQPYPNGRDLPRHRSTGRQTSAICWGETNCKTSSGLVCRINLPTR